MRSQIHFETFATFFSSSLPEWLRSTPAKCALVIAMSLALSGCLTNTRTQGYVIPDDAVVQVRAGTSQDVVKAVLGTPQTQSAFGNETIFYYVETIVEETAFRSKSIKERTVLAVHFGADNRVSRKQTYTLADGRIIDPVTRRTPSYGLDRTFVTQLLQSSFF